MAKINISDLSRFAGTTIYTKGKNYYEKKRVEDLTEIGAGEWHATVEGSNNEYEVTLHIKDKYLEKWECDCPYMKGGLICKHVIATVLTIQDQEDANSISRTSYPSRLQLAKEAMAAARAHKDSKNEPPVTMVVKNIPAGAEQMNHYEVRLGEVERKILKIAALYWQGLSLTRTVDIYNSAGFKYNGVNLQSKDARVLLEGLVKLGYLLRPTDGTYRCVAAFGKDLCDKHFKADPDFTKLVPIMSSVTYMYYYSEIPDVAFRDMRIARYEEKVSVFKKKYLSLKSIGVPYNQQMLLEYWLGKDLLIENMAVFLPEIQTFFLTELLQTAFLHLQNADHLLAFTEARLGTSTEDDRQLLVNLAARLYFLRGDYAALEELSAWATPSAIALYKALVYFKSGEDIAALEAFALSLKEIRRETKNQKLIFEDFMALFHAMCILRSRDTGYLEKVADIVAKKLRSVSDYTGVYKTLEGVLLYLSNNKKQAMTCMKEVPKFPMQQMFMWLLQYYVDPELLNKKQILAHLEVVRKGGFLWMEAELMVLLHRRGDLPIGEHARLEALQQQLKSVPLADVVPRVEDWENALNMLISMAQTPKTTAVRENDTRLAWVVDFDHLTIQPKEQIYGKKGWSSGRNVSMQRLSEGNLSYMTEQDRRVAKHIRGYGIYMHFEEKALQELVGHPLLFLWKSPDVAVQFVEDKPVLLVKQNGKGYTVQFSHKILNEGCTIVKESPTRYKLLRFTPEMVRIARAFENSTSLFVPDQGTEKLKQVLQGLSGLLPVQSALDTDTAHVELVAPDARTCVHLLPVGDGFHVELYVKPFTVVAPYFKPGEGEPSVISLVEGVKKRTNRDLKAEMKNAKKLRADVPVLAETRPAHGIWELEDAEVCLELLLQLDPFVQDKTILLEWPKGEKYRITKVAGIDQLRVNIREKGSWFEVEGELRIDEEKVYGMQELLALSERSKGQFIELSPGKFLALTAEFRRRLREIAGLMTPQKNGRMQLHPLAAPALDFFTSALQHFEADKKFRQNAERLRKAFSQKFPLPDQFKADLRPYQLEGYEWLNRCAEGGVGACLADDMGLGKTIQALALLTRRAALGPALVVAPASVCRNWVKETEKFAPALRPLLFGEGDRAALIDQAAQNDLVIVTYDLMARESEQFIKKQFATIILDEAQAIKNRSTKRSEVAMQLQGDFKMMMSGTPVENHLGELWNLFNFANPGLLGSIDSFQERFVLPIERFQDEHRREQLRRLVHPFILRRRKNEVLKELPEKTEITLSVELSTEERAFYEALRRRAMESLLDNDSTGGEKHLMILAEIMRLRRAACHPRLVDANAGFTESSKLRLFGEIVEELLDNGHKALVFSQFVSHLEILQEYLKKKKISYQYLDGQTPLATRQKRIEAFQGGEGDLFLISLKAGGVGLNLTAADYVIHMDPWWNPAVEDQATDRAHRIGQEKPVTVYRLVAENTIEDKILRLHEHKRDLADSLLAGTDMSAKLSADDLLALIAEK